MTVPSKESEIWRQGHTAGGGTCEDGGGDQSDVRAGRPVPGPAGSQEARAGWSWVLSLGD